MVDKTPAADGLFSPYTRWISALWQLATLFAVVNVLFMIRRAPILHAQDLNGDPQAVQDVADRLQTVPIDARLLVFRSHADPQHEDLSAVWLAYRLNYLIAPRHYAVAWDTLPTNAQNRFDVVLAYGSARRSVPAPWRLLLIRGHASLFAPHWPSLALTHGRIPLPPDHLTLAGAAWGITALAAVPMLGALLAGWTCKRSPFNSLWANLVLSHLIGAAVLAWLLTLGAITTGHLLTWPVYIFVLLALPGWRRARAWLMPPPAEAPESIERDGSEIDDSRDRSPETRLDPDSVRTMPIEAPPAESTPSTRLWNKVVIALIALSLFALVERAWLLGIGWDAYAFWQFKAKVFLRDGNLSVLRDPFYATYAHMDYPLLVPLQTWWVCRHAGGYNERWAQCVGAIFTLDMVVLFYAVARVWITRNRAMMAAALLLSLPLLTAQGISGFADVEVACYLLAIGVMLARTVNDPRQQAGPLLAWLLAGIVLVKNEGLPAALAALAVLVAFRRGREVWGAAMAVGFAHLPWFVLKRRWHLANDLLESGRHPHFTVGLILWRLRVTLLAIPMSLAPPGPAYPCWGLTLLLILVGVFASVRRKIAFTAPLWALCALQLVAYVGIYLITPQPLRSHLGSSLDRLLLHIVPTLLLASLLGCFTEL